MADLLKRQLEKQSAAAPDDASGRQVPDQLETLLERLVAQQEQTNEHLRQQRTAQEANTQELRDWRAATQRSFAQTFFRKMALEVPPVVLAVLLAFGINSWWQNSKQEQLVQSATRNIQTEIQFNLARLESNVEKNQQYLQDLDDQIATLTQEGFNESKDYGRGIAILPLKDAAWRAANLSGAVAQFPSDAIQDMAEVYSYVEAQTSFNVQIYDKVDMSRRATAGNAFTFSKNYPRIAA